MKKACILSLILMLLFCLSCTKENAALEITFLKVGKADAAVIVQNNHAVLIDCGEEDDAKEILSCLKEKNISFLDVLFVSHLDKDHIGAAYEILAEIEVKKILLPDYENDSEPYLRMKQAAEEKGVELVRVKTNTNMTWQDTDIRLYVCHDTSFYDPEKDNDNDMSLILYMRHGDCSVLFTGDAENRRLYEWLSEEDIETCQIVKLPHHGEYQKSLIGLLEAVEPEIAVICDSEKNPAEEKTMALLAEKKVQVYETKDGNIIATSDAKDWTVKQ